jgi:ribosomal protein L32E
MSDWKDNAIWRCPMPQGKTERQLQLELDLEQAKAENLRQEVAKMNKEQEHWWQVRIQAAIKLTCALSEKMLGAGYSEKQIVKQAVGLADVLVEELRKREQDEGQY